MQITLEVRDRIGEKLQQLSDLLPEALDRAIEKLTPQTTLASETKPKLSNG